MLVDEQAGTTAEGAASDSTSTTVAGAQENQNAGGSASSSAGEYDEFLTRGKSVPAEVLEKLIKEHEAGRDIALKNVRKATIEEQFQTRLQDELNKVLGPMNQRLESVQTSYQQMVDAQNQQRWATMDPTEVRLEQTMAHAKTQEQRVALLTTALAQIEEHNSKERVLKYAAENYGLDENDIEELRDAKVNDSNKLVDAMMKKAAAKRKAEMDGVKSLAEKLEAFERKLNGTSTFAATAGGGAGGSAAESNDDSIEMAYFRDPNNPDLARKYREFKQRKGF